MANHNHTQFAALSEADTHPLGRGPGTVAALAVLLLLVLLTQLGEMRHAVISGDESTFILMGADVAAGHLPFVHLFDLKPPVIFLLVGAVIALFGKSLLAVRLLGDFCIFATAALLFLIARRLVNGWAALGGALLYVALCGSPIGQPTFAELPTTAFLLAGAWPLCRRPVSTTGAAAAGLALSLAVLTRTNIAVVAAGIGALLLVAGRLRGEPVSRHAWAAYGVAGLVPVLLLCLLYAAAGAFPILKLAMLDVPLAYSGQEGMLAILKTHYYDFYGELRREPLLFAPAALISGLGVAVMLVQSLRAPRSQRAWATTVILVMAGCTTASLLIGGAAYPHYWLQLFPFAGLACAFALAALARIPGGPLLAGLLVAIPTLSTAAAALPNDAAYLGPQGEDRSVIAAAAYISAHGGPHPRVWAWSDHLVLWYLDTPPLSKAGAYPENLARPAIINTLAKRGYVGNDEVSRLMASKPDYVVADIDGEGVDWAHGPGKAASAWLAENYRLDATFGHTLIYRLR